MSRSEDGKRWMRCYYGVCANNSFYSLRVLPFAEGNICEASILLYGARPIIGLGANALCSFLTSHRGAICAASLTNKLVDSAWLDYHCARCTASFLARGKASNKVIVKGFGDFQLARSIIRCRENDVSTPWK